MSTPVSGSGSLQSPAAAAAAAAAAANAAAQTAGQSLINGSTGNATLDVNLLVSALVNTKIAGPSAMLLLQSQSDTTEITALANLSASLAGLQLALGPFANGSALSAFTANITGDGITATAGAGATAGTFAINTTQVAQAQNITSGAFTAAQGSALGTGTLNISVGGKSMTINVDSSNDSLADIATAINSSSSNPGVNATIVHGTNGDQLSLTSQATGAANVISVSVSGVQNDNGLSSLGVTSSVGTDKTGASTFVSSNASSPWTQSTAAQDAQLTIAGAAVTSASNTITNVLSGVTVTLTPDAAGKTQTLTIAQDSSTIEGDVSSFVTAFNAVVSQLNSLSAANTTNTAGGGGALLGDQMLNQIGQSLASIVGGSVSSGGLKTTLASLGITFNSAAAAGQSFAPLSLDSDTLDAAVQNNPAQVATLFNQTNGIAQQLNAVINTYTDPNTGVITSRTTALTNDIKSVGDQQDDLVALKAQLTQQFQDQFTALNNLMAQMETNTNFLTALFGGKNSAGSLAQGSG